MTKPNRLISILLSVIMLVSLFPQAIFAEDEYVAQIGNDKYATLEEAFDETLNLFDEDDPEPIEIKLLQDAKVDDTPPYAPVKIIMNGHDIKISDGNKLTLSYDTTFENGTIHGDVYIDSPVSVTVTAPVTVSGGVPNYADYAVKGSVYVDHETASLKISDARIGINGTFTTRSATLTYREQ